MKITLEFEFDKYDFENAVEIYAHQYNFSLDDFIKAFDEKPSTYHYLTLIGNKSQQEKKLLEQAAS